MDTNEESWGQKHREQEKKDKALIQRCRRLTRRINTATSPGLGLAKQRRGILVKNTSLWPTLLVNSVADFVLAEIEKRGTKARACELTLQHTSRGGHGHAYKWGYVHVAHNRFRPRMDWKYAGISWAKTNATKTSLQSLCHIIAHEFIHTTDLVTCVRNENGRRNKQQFEFRTDNLAAEIVSEFAKHEQRVWDKYRKHRRTQRNTATRKATAVAARKTPDAKMQRAEANLERWQAELVKTQKHVRRWKVKVNRMNGARKAAAKRAATRQPTLKCS
jgi:hypothetical protein